MKHMLFVLIALAIGSCNQSKETEVKTAPAQDTSEKTMPSGDLNTTGDSVEVTFKTEEAEGVHQAYLELKGAFVNTDATEAAEIATDFNQMLGSVADSETITNLKSRLERIANSEDVKDQRMAFEDVSQQVENYLSDKIVSGTIFKQYCPMAFDGQGAYWLSDSKEIRNPYFGDKMLKCGVVDKELQ